MSTAVHTGVMETRDLCIAYGSRQVLFDVSVRFEPLEVTAIIGPSGCGKSTFLKGLNRILEEEADVTVTGGATLDGQEIYGPDIEVVDLRRRVGMVFQQANLFPASIRETVAFGPRLHGLRAKGDLEGIVQQSLQRAALWDEVKDRLDESATALSGGQQQRLCIARALSVYPDVLLMDEPCAALDPTSTAQVEDTIQQLREHLTVVLVTHNMHQAMRVSQKTAFFLDGVLVEFSPTEELFNNPREAKTSDYILGRFG